MRFAVSCAVLLACAAAPVPYVSPASTIPLSAQSLGPLSGSTPATLVELRTLLAPLDVVPVNVDTDPNTPALEYQVYEGGKLMFVIVPTAEGTILNVHVSTPKVSVVGHPWRVGAPLAGAAVFTSCECWGGKPACFKKGDHVAVTFDRACAGTTSPRGRRALEGLAIKKLVWRPKAFGGDEVGGADYGGAPVIDDVVDP